MACHDFNYAILLLRQAIDFAEIKHDFVPLRKWVNEVTTTIYPIPYYKLVLPTSTMKFCLSANLRIFTNNCNCAHTKCEEGLGYWNQLEPDYVICS
jgi:hypothetical protein